MLLMISVNGSFSRKAVQLIGIISQMMQAQLKTVLCSTTFCALGLFQPTGLVSCWQPACLSLPLPQLLLWQHEDQGKKRRKSHGHHAWSLPSSFITYITFSTTSMWIHSLTQHTVNSPKGCARTLEIEKDTVPALQMFVLLREDNTQVIILRDCLEVSSTPDITHLCSFSHSLYLVHCCISSSQAT